MHDDVHDDVHNDMLVSKRIKRLPWTFQIDVFDSSYIFSQNLDATGTQKNTQGERSLPAIEDNRLQVQTGG